MKTLNWRFEYFVFVYLNKNKQIENWLFLKCLGFANCAQITVALDTLIVLPNKIEHPKSIVHQTVNVTPERFVAATVVIACRTRTNWAAYLCLDETRISVAWRHGRFRLTDCCVFFQRIQSCLIFREMQNRNYSLKYKRVIFIMSLFV